MEIAVGVELRPLGPGVPQAVVDGRRDADLVSHRDGEPRRRLNTGTRHSPSRRAPAGRTDADSPEACGPFSSWS